MCYTIDQHFNCCYNFSVIKQTVEDIHLKLDFALPSKIFIRLLSSQSMGSYPFVTLIMPYPLILYPFWDHLDPGSSRAGKGPEGTSKIIEESL